jgi:outer membrane immunogenic protein
MTPLVTTFPPASVSNVVVPTARTQFRGDIVRLGLNYHFGQSGFETASAPPATFASGFYAGLNAGYSWDSSPSVSTTAIPVQTGLDQPLFATFGLAAAASATGVANANADGALGGGQAGYNYLVDRYVLGVETDLQGASMRGKGGFAASAPAYILDAPVGAAATATTSEKTLDWFGTLRARGGYLVTPSILAYGTGGFAYGGMTVENRVAAATAPAALALQSIGAIGHLSTAHVGWTVGGGLEWRFAPAMSLKAEYLYYDLGRLRFDSGAVATSLFAVLTNTAALSTTTRFSGQIARVGLNYLFDPVDAFPFLEK